MIDQICAYIHNFFLKEKNGDVYHREAGTFTIENGTIDLPFLVDGSYFLISGSRFNDGVYTYPVTPPEPGKEPTLKDETFTGVIWEMRPPKSFLALVNEITAWQARFGDAVSSPYQSESFAGYSYSLKSGATGGADTAASWQGVFRSRLNEWRKIT